MEAISAEETIDVHAGEIVDAGSWVYAWLDGGTVIHVGGTGLPPAVRTWLHLNHDDPQVGRVRARRMDAGSASLRIRAFRLAGDLDRAAVRDAVIRILEATGKRSADWIGPEPTAPGGGLGTSPVEDAAEAIVQRLGLDDMDHG